MSKTKGDKVEKEHPDITYLKQDEIGLVIAKALNETYKCHPNNPIDFFAKWLLNHSKTNRRVFQVFLIISIVTIFQEKERDKQIKELKERNR